MFLVAILTSLLVIVGNGRDVAKVSVRQLRGGSSRYINPTEADVQKGNNSRTRALSRFLPSVGHGLLSICVMNPKTPDKHWFLFPRSLAIFKQRPPSFTNNKVQYMDISPYELS